jgi:ABC-type lipoprotein release transport system permease subunit
MGTFKIAWRNIWRNQRRTSVTVAAMALAVFVTLGYSTLMAGMIRQMESDALDFELGAVQVLAPGYQDRPSLHTSIADTQDVLSRLRKAKLVATSRLLGAGLVASGDASAGASLRGVDLVHDPEVLSVSQHVMEGQWLAASDPKGVVVGRKLARTLGVTPGSELIVLGQARDGSMANDLFTVRGVLKSVGDQTDRAGVFMSQAAFRELLAYDEGAHQLIIKRPAVLDTPAIKSATITAAPGLHVQSWRDLSPTLATMMDSTRGMMTFFFLIINLAIAIVVLNAMLMSVFERIREFGVLKALGMGPGPVLRLIYAESLLQVGIAVTAGLVLAVPALWYLSTRGISMAGVSGTSVMGVAMMDRWYAVVTPVAILQPVLTTVVVVVIAVLYPAAKAARIHPVEAMGHQ